MRSDEEFVKDRLVKFLGASVEAEPGPRNHAPDYYFTVDGVKIAVEVTQLSPVSYEETGLPKNRKTTDESLCDLCDELDADFRTEFPERFELVLHIAGPVHKPRQFRKQIRRAIGDILRDPAVVPGWRKEYVLAGEKLTVSAIAKRAKSAKKIVGVIWNKDSIPEIEVNAQVILGTDLWGRS